MADGIVGEFLALKEETDADLLAMQCGDFYEFFADDAETVGEELDLKISEKSSHGSSYPMAGVPVDDLTPYLKALVERGYRVAVADQRGPEDTTREVVRVATPGTLPETDDDDAQYLASVVDDGAYGLAFCDVTTGRFRVTSVDADRTERALAELYRFSPVEILPGPDVRDDEEFLADVRERLTGRVTIHDADAFAPGRTRHTLETRFGGATKAVEFDDAAVRAAGAVLAYVEETGVGALPSVTRLETYTPDEHVSIDATTQRNLELTEAMTEGGRTLLETIDHTATSAGRRLLEEWLRRPLRQPSELRRRSAAVEALLGDPLARERLCELLGDTYDLERIASRAVSGSADARTLLRARETLSLVSQFRETVEKSARLADSPVAELLGEIDETAVEALTETLTALSEDPPKTLREGGLIRRGYDEELDELIERHEAAREFFETLEDREKRRHGLSRLTVDRNKTDGYYVQVGKSESDDVPDHYEGIKTLKNAERYVFAELRENEREVLRLEEARGDREYEAFCRLRETVAERADLLQSVGGALAELDVVCSLGTHAARWGWSRPELTDDSVLEIEAGRHPVVETDVEFVPNDLYLDRNRHFLLVTGPNMSGKSTYMRQAALTVLLAQIGSFVPADSARVGLVDGIYTRVGALDELAGGRSTFMVEMSELSKILHSATDESLVVLDEVGRGTATYDGISIAWAATEYLSEATAVSPSPMVLFATHYHELTALADRIDGVGNVHMAADESDGDVTFLRTVREGPADRSYGIHVAELAGVPEPVVTRAEDVLEKLRKEEAIDVRGGSGETRQVVFDLDSGSLREPKTADGRGGSSEATRTEDTDRLSPDAEDVLEELRTTDVESTSPLDLMTTVEEWKRRLREE